MVFVNRLALLIAVPFLTCGLAHGRQFQAISDAFPLAGTSTTSQYGDSVALLGDLNGDGFREFAIGDPGAGSGAGAVHVFDGKPEKETDAALPWIRFVRIQTLTGSANQEFGASICAVGDVSGDGVGDVAISAPGYTASANPDEGAVFIYETSDWDAWTLDETVTAIDPALYTRFGERIASCGQWSLQECVAIVAVADSDDDEILIFWDVDADDEIESWDSGDTSGELGYWMVGTEDIDGDGTRELIASRPGASSDTGAIHVFSWNSSSVVTTSQAWGGNGGDRFGHSFSISDLDPGDGQLDLAIGVPGADVVKVTQVEEDSGSPQQFTFSTPLSTISAPTSSTDFGTSVAFIGDVTGDEVPDLAIGAPAKTVTNSGDGALYVYDVSNLASPSLKATLAGNATSAGHARVTLPLDGPYGSPCKRLLVVSASSDQDPCLYWPLRPFPYRMSIDVTVASTRTFNPIHGVNGIPISDDAWTIADLATATVTVEDRDFSDRFDALQIPQGRMHLEGRADDLNHIWDVPVSELDVRDYTGDTTNSGNYDVGYLEAALNSFGSGTTSFTGDEAIFRVGHDWFPGAGSVPPRFNSPPFNDPNATPNPDLGFDSFAAVVTWLADYMTSTSWSTPCDIIELWNEPFNDHFWETTSTAAEEYAELVDTTMEELLTVFSDSNGDGVPDDLTVLVALNGSANGFTDWGVDMLNKLDTLTPSSFKLNDVTVHSYTGYPRRIYEKVSSMDYYFEQDYSGFGTPNLWITEWNRAEASNQYVHSLEQVPFIVNTMYYLDAMASKDLPRLNDGEDFTMDLVAANFFAAGKLWEEPGGSGVNLRRLAGLAFEAYADYLYMQHRDQVPVEGLVFEPFGLKYDTSSGEVLYPSRDFVVMAGVDPDSVTPNACAIVLSNVTQFEPDEFPGVTTTYSSATPDDAELVITVQMETGLDALDIDLTRLVPRYDDETDPNYASDEEHEYTEVLNNGTATPAAVGRTYSSWTYSYNSTTGELSIDLDKVFNNTFEVLLLTWED